MENEDELCAREWLQLQGHRDIRLSCDDPPDYIVDDSCAVEVTRLNQKYDYCDDRSPIGEEQISIPLSQTIENIILRLGPPGNEGDSWTIDYEYNPTVPLCDLKFASRQIKEALKPLTEPYNESVIFDMHSSNFNDRRHAGESSCHGFPHLCLDCGICITLTRFAHKPEKFILQNVDDGYGIAVAEELYKSIRYIIREKSGKVRGQNKIGKYRSWCLILVDYICHRPIDFSQEELAQIRNQDYDFWTRVVIIASRKPQWYIELYSTGIEIPSPPPNR